jgi:hypothetical protein
MFLALGRRPAWAFAATAFALLAPARVAHGYCRTTTVAVPPNYSPTRGCFNEGLPLFWRNACISYSIVEAASAHLPLAQAQPVIDQAFATWNAIKCPVGGQTLGIATSPTALVTCNEVRYNENGPNQNAIIFRDDSWPYTDSNNTLGLTTVTFNADNGEIFDADMEINASGKNLSVGDPVPARGFDLLSVVTHEVGHFLGLAHSNDPRATMYPSYKPGTTSLRSLTSDDIDGVCSIYPSTTEREVSVTVNPSGQLNADSCDPTPRHGFGTTCAENPPPNTPSKGCAVAGGRVGVAEDREAGWLAAVAAALALATLGRFGRVGEFARRADDSSRGRKT